MEREKEGSFLPRLPLEKIVYEVSFASQALYSKDLYTEGPCLLCLLPGERVDQEVYEVSFASHALYSKNL